MSPCRVRAGLRFQRYSSRWEDCHHNEVSQPGSSSVKCVFDGMPAVRTTSGVIGLLYCCASARNMSWLTALVVSKNQRARHSPGGEP